MSVSTISVRVSSEDKIRFEEFCENTGLNVSSAINIYIKAVLMNNQIPFDIKNDVPVSKDIPNAVTEDALNEADNMAANSSFKGYSDMQSLRNALGV